MSTESIDRSIVNLYRGCVLVIQNFERVCSLVAIRISQEPLECKRANKVAEV